MSLCSYNLTVGVYFREELSKIIDNGKKVKGILGDHLDFFLTKKNKR